MITEEFKHLVNETYEKCMEYGRLKIQNKNEEASLLANEIDLLSYDDLAKMKALSMIGNYYKNSSHTDMLRPVIDFAKEVEDVKAKYSKDDIVSDLLFCNDAITMSVGLHYV